MSRPSNPSHQLFLKVIGECGKRYLSCGGATSRLENILSTVGDVHGFKTEVFATPTGLFICSENPHESKEFTVIRRIKANSSNFTELNVIDQYLQELTHPSADFNQMAQDLEAPTHCSYNNFTLLVSFFLVATMGSLISFGDLIPALLSGVVALNSASLNQAMARFVPAQSIFSVFLASLFGFGFSVALALTLNLSPVSIAIGTLLIFVPGLSLTSAISELAEGNLVSGTVKIGRSVLILLSMGVAYLLVQNIGDYWLLPNPKIETFFLNDLPSSRNSAVALVSYVILLVFFSFTYQTPRHLVLYSTLCGLLSFFVFHLFTQPKTFVMAAFVASFTVGFSSLLFSRWKKVPSQIFSTSGILALVPGMLALSSFYSFTDTGPQTHLLARSALTAGAIALGLLSARTTLLFWSPSSEN